MAKFSRYIPESRDVELIITSISEPVFDGLGRKAWVELNTLSQDDIAYVRSLIGPLDKRAQSIRFSAPRKIRYSRGKTFRLTAVSTSGLRVKFDSLTPRVLLVRGSRAILRRPGKARIRASQPGNTTFAPATSVARSIRIL